MESKFIDGTNEQYSIREDGVVIRHYTFSRNRFKKGTKVFEDVYSKTWMNDDNTMHCCICGKVKTVKNLVAKYFNIENQFENVHPNHVVLFHKNNNPFDCSFQNLQYKLRNTFDLAELSLEERTKIYKSKVMKRYHLDIEVRTRIKLNAKNWRNNNLEKVRLREAIIRKRKTHIFRNQRLKITKSYASSKLQIPVEFLNDEVYDLYKKTLFLKRKVANNHQVHISKIV